jgi:hypothetical protein
MERFAPKFCTKRDSSAECGLRSDSKAEVGVLSSSPVFFPVSERLGVKQLTLAAVRANHAD